jgi:FtsP/CotA-like multicopper oxidase with cupredoxin domain
MITRRHVLAGAGLGLACTIAPASLRGETREPGEGIRVLRAQRAASPGSGAPASAVWGYDGEVPGPVLRVTRGEEVKLRLVNKLDEATTLHWRGVRLINAMDGVAHLTQKPVAPGESFDCRFTAPDAGTFWYGPHDFAPDQLARGLAGALIVSEAEPVAIDRELVLVLADRRLPAGDPDRARAGGEDAHVTVNGRPSLDVPVKTNERLRLRLVNASPVRPLSLRFAQHRVTVMAVDGQPAEPFVAREGRVFLGPGNRLDLFADMELAPGSTAASLVAGAEAPLIRFVYHDGAPLRAAALPDPAPLPANGLPARIDLRTALRLDVPIDAPARPWIGADAALAGRYGTPAFTAKRGRTIVLAFANRTAAAAVVHLHGHPARLLDNLDDGWKPFWLDTVVVAAQHTARLAFVADNPGKWLIHCGTAATPAGMAVWFEVR